MLYIPSNDSLFVIAILLFDVDACKDITSKSEKLSYVASKWKSLSADEQDLWHNEATKVGKFDIKNLTVEQRKKYITKSKKNLIAEVNVLSYD